jgi:hypothetical protein
VAFLGQADGDHALGEGILDLPERDGVRRAR